MFETLFRYPAVVTRQSSGPFAEARERFLNHCASQGLARATLVRRARELLVIAERIDITRGEAIGLSTIEAAADRWVREQRQRQRAQGLRWSREFFVHMAKAWLHFLGRLELPKPKIVPIADRQSTSERGVRRFRDSCKSTPFSPAAAQGRPDGGLLLNRPKCQQVAAASLGLGRLLYVAAEGEILEYPVTQAKGRVDLLFIGPDKTLRNGRRSHIKTRAAS